MKPRVLITGASSGIGAAFARAYAAKNADLVLVARRENNLEALASELRSKFEVNIEILACDLADANTPGRIKQALESRDLTIDILINNAGYGVPGTFIENSWETHQACNQVMVTAVAELTHLFVPNMITKRTGAVINVASIAGLIPSTAGHTLYGAVKSWMIRFTEALAEEVLQSNVKVMAVCPGFTYSEFHDVTGTRRSVEKLPGIFWLSADDVAEKTIVALETEAKTIFIPGKFNRFLVALIRLLPDVVVRALVRRYSLIARISD